MATMASVASRRERSSFAYFKIEEEIAIREFIIANYVIPGGLFTKKDLWRIAMQAFLAKHQDSDDPLSSTVLTVLSKTSTPGMFSAHDARTINGGRKRI
jgi:hypothetical protein